MTRRQGCFSWIKRIASAAESPVPTITIGSADVDDNADGKMSMAVRGLDGDDDGEGGGEATVDRRETDPSCRFIHSSSWRVSWKDCWIMAVGDAGSAQGSAFAADSFLGWSNVPVANTTVFARIINLVLLLFDACWQVEGESTCPRMTYR